MPTFTNDNNSSIATRTTPVLHGIGGNFFFDSRTGREAPMNSSTYLRADTIFSHAQRAGAKRPWPPPRKSCAIFWPTVSSRRAAALALGFQNSVSYALLVWVPVYFLGKDFQSNPLGRWISVALPVGMALGAVASGWISDRYCDARRGGVIASFMLLAGLSALTMYFLPTGHRLGVPVLFVTGFFAHGPKSAFWALAPDLCGRARAGTAVGLMNFFAYAMPGLGNPLIGWMIQHNPFPVSPGVESVAVVFPITTAFALCSAVLAVVIRR